MKQVYRLNTAQIRKNAAQACLVAPDGHLVVIDEPTKKRAQEEKYHAMIGDIASQIEMMGEKWDKEDAKRLLIDAFARVMKEAGTPLKQSGRIVPSLDGAGVVQLGIQSRKFTVREAAEFIEYLYFYGEDNHVMWADCGGPNND